MNAIVKSESAHEVMESVLIKGDLSRLTPEERNSYYRAVCTSVGLNPLTKPLEYITLNGKLRLYALKDCTDQLRSIHKVSVTDMTEAERDGVYIVKCKVQNAEGRTDMAIGAVNIANLKGEALANAMMKTETKSKRRATLSICGLGMLDETEVDDIPASAKAPVPSPAPVTQIAKAADPVVEIRPTTEGPHKIVGGTYETWTKAYINAVQSAGDAATVYAWVDANGPQLEKLGKGSPEHSAKARAETEKHLAFLRKTDPISSGPQKPADDFPGDTPMDSAKSHEPVQARRGRPPKAKIPDISKDYDGWVAYYVKAISEATSIDQIGEIFVSLEGEWHGLMSPDKTALSEARNIAEDKFAP